MPGIIHITAPVEITKVSASGVSFVLRSGETEYPFFVERHDARVGTADFWRVLDESERTSTVVQLPRKKRA